MTENTKKKIVRWFWILLLAPIALIILLLGIVWAFAKIPSYEELENPDSKLATQVIAEEGEILTTYHIENRTFVSYEELPLHLVQATVATEDARFYSHSGIDIPSLFRVLFKTLLSRDTSQGGGSTITQQLAKTLYPRKEHASKLDMIWIKLREWITAVKLERNYTKEEIRGHVPECGVLRLQLLRHPVRLPAVLRQEPHRSYRGGERRPGGHGQQAYPL
jgi:Membrane carboxypeptidase/penicillin-binding protein